MRIRLTDKIYVFEEIPRQAAPTSRTPLLAPGHRKQEEEEESLCSQILLVLVFFIFFISICLIGFWIGGCWGRSTERICTSYVSQYYAGQEVDAVWNDLGIDYCDVVIPATLAARSGITADHVKVDKKYGGGYAANIEGLSHLNCLNLLRQGLWYNYDYYQKKGEGAFNNDIPILKLHVSHCLDIVRQQLMCTVDIGVMGKIWVHPETSEAYQDSDTKHKCRDFDAVKNWAEQRQMPADVPVDYLQQPEGGETVYSTYP